MPSSPARLCAYCSDLPLRKLYNLQDLDSSDRSFVSLGTVSRIRSSPCPLCRLVSHALHEAIRIDPARVRMIESEDKVSLDWSDPGSGERRAGFKLRGVTAAWLAFGVPGDNDIQSYYLSHPKANNWAYLHHRIEPQIDFSRLRGWIAKCGQGHTSCPPSATGSFANMFPGLGVLRLIDVEEGCLIETIDTVRYVALSYVWGTSVSPTTKTTKRNKSSMMRPGSLLREGKPSSRLPLTVANAMTLVRNLGFRYLWVDALCLVQNDAEDVRRGVDVMDMVYEMAYLTIIAACGHDSSAGLPGVEPGVRAAKALVHTVDDGIQMGLYTEVDQLLQTSVYESRAWTLQEHILSRRILYFLDDNVFFRCREREAIESCRDHLELTHRGGTTVWSLLPDSILMEHPLDDYASIVGYYSERALTNQGDALRAMAGIMRRFWAKLGYPMLEGLPTGAFDIFLVFLGEGLSRRSGFPSYSWAGWRGRVVFEAHVAAGGNNEWLEARTWIIWYKRSQHGSLHIPPKPVWDLAANESFPIHDLKYEGYRKRSPFKHPNLKVRSERTMPTDHIALPQWATRLGYPVLQFWTLSVFLRLGRAGGFTGNQAEILDSNGSICGHVYLDGFEDLPFFDSRNDVSEFIVLSESNHPLDYKDPMMKFEDNWKWYNVMLIEWTDGLAERRGLGKIEKDAVLLHRSCSPRPSWKEIVLG
ncbi:heterokaryon incompatibility protein-domain-containing protein [Cercophora newfieldiana]|uniref:Heterokaryon incompatibility protein-domain-containing protein n=1 Tax=Cercophora newfieldiana TaxID=92897 RepID=A0AA40CSZ7_9PEZI|nr:heterokaryon incompatibility protein-domain-containing protein [Cercophora newfieldiana]